MVDKGKRNRESSFILKGKQLRKKRSKSNEG